MAGFNVSCLPQDGERITGQVRTRGGAVVKGRGKRGIAPWLLGEIDAPDYIYFTYMHMYCIVSSVCGETTVVIAVMISINHVFEQSFHIAVIVP